MRRTRILATLGPASTEPDALLDLLRAGADAVRLNFSHGAPEHHARVYEAVREAAAKLDRAVPILQDIQGPKIRIGKLPEPVELREGDEVRFRVGEEQTEPGVLPITYAHLAVDVREGARILMDDGYLAARVKAIEDKETVLAVIEEGGRLKSNKGVNFPGVRLSAKFPTHKDKQDLHFGQRLGVDYVAASFVRSAADIARVRAEIEDDLGTRVIAKVELQEAVENLDEIIRASDGVMVARGDLGVELPAEDVPLVQKDILLRCDRLGVPSITATQMLESMIENPRPTRAEVTDVFNAVLDGTGAVMLSAETAVGKHPRKAVGVMGRIIEKAEHELLEPHGISVRRGAVTTSQTFDVIGHSAARAAEEAGARAIMVLTHQGLSARMVSKYKPRVPILACTTVERTYQRLNLLWGVTPLRMEYREREWASVGAARRAVLASGFAQPDDTVVVVNSRAGVRTPANTLRIGRLKELGED